MNLRVDSHIRGHVASCNGRVDKLRIKIEQEIDNPGNAAEQAAHVEDWSKNEWKRKELRLAQFRREVKSRVSAREKLIQEEIAATSSKAMQSEQDAVERALKLDKTKVPRFVVVGQDIDDVKVIASGKDSSFPNSTNPSSALQEARRALLSCNKDNGSTSKQNKTPKKDSTSQNYHSVHQMRPENCSLRLSMETDKTGTTAAIVKKFTPSGQLEHMQKKQAGNQYLLFRRLYSDLEREQARKNQLQRSHAKHVEVIKKKKESNRRMIEDEINATECFSTVSTDAFEDQQRAVEWTELMLLEERKQDLQRAKEMERYVAALKARLKNQIERRKLKVPPMCSCGDTIWDANPRTCANNCEFYRNPKAYLRALTNLLQSLNVY